MAQHGCLPLTHSALWGLPLLPLLCFFTGKSPARLDARLAEPVRFICAGGGGNAFVRQ